MLRNIVVEILAVLVSHIPPVSSLPDTTKNLLAQEYVKEYKYPWTKQTPGCLDWDHRKSLIVDQLLDPQAKADIFCLQEAQVDLFEELLSSVSSVYSGVIQNVTRGHNVGRYFGRITGVGLILCEVFSDLPLSWKLI